MAKLKPTVKRNPLKEQRKSGLSQVLGESHNQENLRSFRERTKATGLKVNLSETLSTVWERLNL